MAVVTHEIEENGIPYRVTEDPETGLYIKESLQLPPPEPTPDARIAQLESENALIALELVETQIQLEQVQQEQAVLLLELVDKGVI
jgi:hypothetical protein